MLIGGALLQGGITYWLILQYLRHLARADKLPAWIYGWSVDIANSVDNASEIVIAYVLTNAEKDDKSIVYGGVLYDIALKPDGCVSRITLWDCERYLADLSAKLPDPTLPEALSRFPFMLIESSNIRNIAFEVITSTETSAKDEQDILTQAMIRLYAGSSACL